MKQRRAGFYRMVRSAGVMLCAIMAMMGCEKFETSPYAILDNVPSKPSNLVNMERLAAREPMDDDTLTIVFTGEAQRFYEEQEAIVARANSIPGVDLFILAGDLADFGLAQEFEWVHDRMERLTMPWFAAVGNHDLQANGNRIFQQRFGPLNYSFTYKGYKFLFHDTNGREYGFNGSVPDLTWLAHEMADPAPRHFIAVSHVPPFNSDFDAAVVGPYTQQLGSDERTILSLHGHTGSYVDGQLYNDHVRYIMANAMNWPRFLVLKVHQGTTTVEQIDYRP